MVWGDSHREPPGSRRERARSRWYACEPPGPTDRLRKSPRIPRVGLPCRNQHRPGILTIDAAARHRLLEPDLVFSRLQSGESQLGIGTHRPRHVAIQQHAVTVDIEADPSVSAATTRSPRLLGSPGVPEQAAPSSTPNSHTVAKYQGVEAEGRVPCPHLDSTVMGGTLRMTGQSPVNYRSVGSQPVEDGRAGSVGEPAPSCIRPRESRSRPPVSGAGSGRSFPRLGVFRAGAARDDHAGSSARRNHRQLGRAVVTDDGDRQGRNRPATRPDARPRR